MAVFFLDGGDRLPCSLQGGIHIAIDTRMLQRAAQRTGLAIAQLLPVRGKAGDGLLQLQDLLLVDQPGRDRIQFRLCLAQRQLRLAGSLLGLLVPGTQPVQYLPCLLMALKQRTQRSALAVSVGQHLAALGQAGDGLPGQQRGQPGVSLGHPGIGRWQLLLQHRQRLLLLCQPAPGVLGLDFGLCLCAARLLARAGSGLPLLQTQLPGRQGGPEAGVIGMGRQPRGHLIALLPQGVHCRLRGLRLCSGERHDAPGLHALGGAGRALFFNGLLPYLAGGGQRGIGLLAGLPRRPGLLGRGGCRQHGLVGCGGGQHRLGLFQGHPGLGQFNAAGIELTPPGQRGSGLFTLRLHRFQLLLQLRQLGLQLPANFGRQRRLPGRPLLQQFQRLALLFGLLEHLGREPAIDLGTGELFQQPGTLLVVAVEEGSKIPLGQQHRAGEALVVQPGNLLDQRFLLAQLLAQDPAATVRLGRVDQGQFGIGLLQLAVAAVARPALAPAGAVVLPTGEEFDLGVALGSVLGHQRVGAGAERIKARGAVVQRQADRIQDRGLAGPGRPGDRKQAIGKGRCLEIHMDIALERIEVA